MRLNGSFIHIAAILWTAAGNALPARSDDAITAHLFSELEELARIVDVSYCVGLTGISKPFQCLGRCKDFPNFELVTTWNTGPLLSDSCGYIALDHSPTNPRILVAFRGTYSIANTIVDLSTIPQAYTPYIDSDTASDPANTTTPCPNCTVHAGFLLSWHNTRTTILPTLYALNTTHPGYTLHLIGHSLGGAVALLAALETSSRGWSPIVTTFGEPRVGNAAFAAHVDTRFANPHDGNFTGRGSENGTYRRVTHVDDPVPLLPLTEWGYLPHAHELYIRKPALPPDVGDVRRCEGATDDECSAGADPTLLGWLNSTKPKSSDADDSQRSPITGSLKHDRDSTTHLLQSNPAQAPMPAVLASNSLTTPTAFALIPTRYKLWQLFFAHRDYFWRLGVCLPSVGPWEPPWALEVAEVEIEVT